MILGVDQTSRADFPLLALMTTFSIVLFVPLLAIAVYALWDRSWVSGAVLFVGMVLFLAAHPIFPQKPLFAAEKPSTTIEMMTFNTGLGITPADQISTALMSQSAAIVGIQEATTEQIEHFDLQLRDQYAYQLFDPSGSGIGLLSAHPIIESQWLQPPTKGRPMLHATLDVSGQPMHVFVAHISWPTIMRASNYGIPSGLHEYWQAQEIYFLQQQAESVNAPVIIMGDFNMSDQSHSYKELTAEFGDAFRDGGWGLGFTFPNYRTIWGHTIETPVLRIDYIFYDEVLQIEQAQVGCFESASDHCALISHFELP